MSRRPSCVRVAIPLLGIVVGMPQAAVGQCLGNPPSRILPAGLTLKIRPDQPVAEISRPVMIHIEFRNGTDRPIGLWDRWMVEIDYELHVRDSDGKEPALGFLGRKLRTPPTRGHNTGIVLAPGETYTGKEDLTGIYAVKIPGTYTVEVCRDVVGWGMIYSNRIALPFVMPAIVAK